MSTPQTDRFADHFQALRQSVEQLRTLEVQDLDELVALVGTASVAYQGCKTRIAAVRALLGENLEGLPEG